MKRLAPVLMLAAFVAGCAVNPVTGKTELSLISRDQEIALGREAAPEFEKEFGDKVADAQLQAYVQTIGGRIAAVSDRPMPYEFALLNSDVPNAFAMPGGKVYVTKGLMKLMTNERQLAAVIGHEVGHVAHKHSVNMLQRQMGTAILVEIAAQASGSETVGQVAQVVGNLKGLQHSRQQEYQADSAGIKYMAKARYNPHGMVELLTHLQSLSTSQPGRLDEMFSTHPLTPERIKEAQELIRKNHPTAHPGTTDPNAARFGRMKTLLK